MPIRITGLNSGLDTESIISALVSSYSYKTSKYKKAQTKLSWKQEAWSTLNSKVYSFYNNVGKLKMSSAYNMRTASVSDSTKAKVSAASGATNGVQSLEVLEVAKSDYLTGGKISIKDASGAEDKTKTVSSASTLSELGYTGTGTIEVTNKETGKTTSISVTGDTKISDFVKSLSDAGVKASFDEKNGRLFVSSAKTGTENGFELKSKNADGDILKIHAKDTVLATGGIGGLYKHSTNFPSLTGDGLDVAKKHGVRLEHLDYVQIHPTSLYSKKPGRSFLISESTRGEGAVLLNGKGERFVDELLPRDVVTQAIEKEMEKEGSDHVWLSFKAVPEETIRNHFPHIYEECLKEGYDITKEPAPVVPAQHYFMGGIYVDHFSETTMDHLYAVGETSCNGVHGKNRLASNSLLESLVFAERAAGKIAGREDEEYESNYDAACCG